MQTSKYSPVPLNGANTPGREVSVSAIDYTLTMSLSYYIIRHKFSIKKNLPTN